MSCVAFHDCVAPAVGARELVTLLLCRQAGLVRLFSASRACQWRTGMYLRIQGQGDDGYGRGVSCRVVARRLGWSAAANRWRIPLSVCAAERVRCKSGVSLSFVTAAEDSSASRAVDAAGVRR